MKFCLICDEIIEDGKEFVKVDDHYFGSDECCDKYFLDIRQREDDEWEEWLVFGRVNN
jgi:hypothetical protein